MRTASGKFELSHQIEFIIWINGSELSITLNKIYFEKNSGCKWSLENVESYVEFEYSIKDAIKVLKDALAVYGYSGIHRQIDNYKVSFYF